jgi:hypothetical protein
METLELYIIRNAKGKYFHAKGYGGCGESWVDDIKNARIYAKIGPARSQVTFWATTYPQYGRPVILRMTATITEIMDEEERIKKVNENKIREKHNREISNAKWRLESAKEDLERAKREMQKAQKTLNQK